MNSSEPCLPANIRPSPAVDLVVTNTQSRVLDTLRAAGHDGVDPATDLVLVGQDAVGAAHGTPPWISLADRDTVIENLDAEDWHWNVALRSAPEGHIPVMLFGPDGLSVGSVVIPDLVPRCPPTEGMPVGCDEPSAT